MSPYARRNQNMRRFLEENGLLVDRVLHENDIYVSPLTSLYLRALSLNLLISKRTSSLDGK